MFGLLQNRKLTTEENYDFRINYCGTCKTIGKLYGHKERVLLNFDVVFLSELLATVNNCKEDFIYIKPFTCWTLPEKEEQIPHFLKYTASINILLGHFKIVDNINDSKQKLNIWTLFKYLTNSNFKSAKKYLIEQNLHVDIIEKQVLEQFNREKQKVIFPDFYETLSYYSNQTAQITGLVFKQSVARFNDEQLSKTFWKIGANFGKIVYLIDAIEDYEKDKKRRGFNLFLLYNLTDKSNLIESAASFIYEQLDRIKKSIYLLPIPETKQKTFINNLLLNINNKIAPKKCCSTLKNCTNKIFSIKERYQFAINTARIISLKRKNIIIRYLSFAILTFSLLFLFILFPHLIPAENHALYKADCCSNFFEWGNHCSCCGTCCGFCCDGCINDCCKVEGSSDTCSNGHAATDMANGCPCASCCGCMCLIGLCGGCAGGASEGPKVIVKVIQAPAKGCC